MRRLQWISFLKKILIENKVICAKIEKRKVLHDDGLLAQNVLSKLRNFIETTIFHDYN